jgi:hypothetical protein
MQQAGIKSKWNSLKTWFTPDINRRRPSQCSMTSNSSCGCQQDDLTLFSQKRPSLMDEFTFPFRRRSSNASSELSQPDFQKETEKVYDMYALAIDEINYAEDSRGSPYYSGDRIAAKEAIDTCHHAYVNLLNLHECNRDHLEATIGLKMAFLQEKYESLHLNDDQRSF